MFTFVFTITFEHERSWRVCDADAWGQKVLFLLRAKTEAPLEADGFYRLTTSDPCLSA